MKNRNKTEVCDSFEGIIRRDFLEYLLSKEGTGEFPDVHNPDIWDSFISFLEDRDRCSIAQDKE